MGAKKEKGMTSAELSSFCGQVAMLLESGLPLYDGMETLAQADSTSVNAEMYQEASRRVNEVGSLYEALKGDDRWPAYLVEMTGIEPRSKYWIFNVFDSPADSAAGLNVSLTCRCRKFSDT